MEDCLLDNSCADSANFVIIDLLDEVINRLLIALVLWYFIFVKDTL